MVSLSPRAWHLQMLGLSQHQQLSPHRFCLLFQGMCACVLWGVLLGGMCCVWRPAASHLSASRDILWMQRKRDASYNINIQEVSPKTYVLTFLCFLLGKPFFGRSHSWNFAQGKGGTKHFKQAGHLDHLLLFGSIKNVLRWVLVLYHFGGSSNLLFHTLARGNEFPLLLSYPWIKRNELKHLYYKRPVAVMP